MTERIGQDRPWSKPSTREARNEQAKLRGALLNAVAITLVIAASVGPFINPDLGRTLTIEGRILMGLASWTLHLLARFAVRGMEDR